MKRICSIFLIVCLVMTLGAPLTVFAGAAEADWIPYAVEGGSLYFDPTTGTVTRADSTVTGAVIPSEIGGVTVKALGDSAFSAGLPGDTLKSVVLPDTLESIGSECFRYQTGLTEITVPSGVTTIETETFFGCKGLEKITLPSTLKTIAYQAFWGCSALEEIRLPEGLETIGDFVFVDCSALTSLNIPQSVKEIGDLILAGTAYEQDPAHWVGGGLYVDNWLLHADQERKTLTVRLGTCGLAGSIAGNGTHLKNIYLPEGLKYISSNCFDGSKIPSFVIPSTVERIGERAFRYYSFSGSAPALSLYFKGNAPVIGRDQFSSMAAGDEKPRDVTIYRSANSTGWDQENLMGCTFVDWDSPCKKLTDVAPYHWHYGAVSAMVDRGLMNGMSDTVFAPNKTMTRAMLVTVLWRYSGSPEGFENTFTDVADGQWYTKAVAWAAEKGIVNGVGNGRFNPNGLITREQLVVMIYRFATLNGMDAEARTELTAFTDADKVSSYAQDAVQWAVATGLLNGVEENGIITLRPQGNATRAQVCAILQRYLEQQ